MLVLNGDHPGRADEAARLYRGGLAREVWLTNDPRSGGEVPDGGTWSNARRLEGHGIPPRAIVTLPGAAVSTRAELDLVRAETARRGLPCLIAVTSPLHARRVKTLWWLQGGATRLIVRQAREARYAGWRALASELGRTLISLAGLGR